MGRGQVLRRCVLGITAWPAGLTPKSDVRRGQFKIVIGDTVDAILKTDDGPLVNSAIARNRRPMSREEWRLTSVGSRVTSVGPPPQPCELLRISRPDVRPHFYRFEKTQARVSFPVVCEGVV